MKRTGISLIALLLLGLAGFCPGTFFLTAAATTQPLLLSPGDSSSESENATQYKVYLPVLLNGNPSAGVPVADFNYSPGSPVIGQSVQFTDTSGGGPTSWSWNFGDGTSSTSQNPSHTFSQAGTFPVYLTASNSHGNHTKQRPVVVAAAGGTLAAAFNFTPASPVTGQSVQFTDTSTGGPTGWSWNFGDGSTSTSQNPTHAFAGSGQYTVTLTASNAGGSNAKSRNITVSAPTSKPTAAFDFSPGSPTVSQPVQFTDKSSGAPTSWSWDFGDGSNSTLQSPTHTYSSTGIFTVSFTAQNSLGSGSTTQNLIVVESGIEFTMAQTVSDGAQRTTLAFSGLAMMTGNLEAQSFFPPGKVADYTGFQYLRDNDPDNMGHNTSFLTRVAYNVIYILNTSQFNQLKTLASNQISQINQYGYQRFPLMKAFRRLLAGTIPTGSSGLNLNSVRKASRELYLLDGQISYDRAVLYAAIINSFDASQKACLDAMKGKGFNSWPDITSEQVKTKMQGLEQGTSVAVMTYAGDLFSWYAGGVDADVYFCPERQGTYYGSFYMKDAPAVGHEGYSIDEQLTATAGAALCDSSKGYVTADQAAVMSSLVDLQKANLYGSPTSNIVKVRTQIAVLLRGLLTAADVGNAVKNQVLSLSGTYGDLDGENNYYYATLFAQVYKTMTTDQKSKLMTLRSDIMSGTYSDGTPFDFTVCNTPFLYSAVISDLTLLSPYVDNTDYLFFEPVR